METELPAIRHRYSFDPTYGYSLRALLDVEPPQPPHDFASFWETRFERATQTVPRPHLVDTLRVVGGYRVFDLWFQSTQAVTIGGWLLLPTTGRVERGFVIGHGYGGRMAPDVHLPLGDAALLFPCSRGISRSALPSIPSEPNRHVLHEIQNRERYVLGGCVEDVWLSVSCLLQLFPQVQGRVGYLGISFGGGIGALALPWDHRIQRAHLNVPSFGHHPLRMGLPTFGSALAVQKYAQKHRDVLENLAYFDAAIAAQFISVPVHCACAAFDPVVAPPGQFAIYNALPGAKELFVLRAGHHPLPESREEETQLLQNLQLFFADT